MDSIVPYLLSDSSDDDFNVNLKRSQIRKESNILLLNETEFKNLFRLTKDAFKYVLSKIEQDFKKTTTAGITPTIKLAATLRFLAQGSYQKSVGQDFYIGLSQQATSNVISETLNILQRNLCSEWISLVMSDEEKSENKREFYRKSGFPGVIGCVDGSQIKIVKPKENEHIFFCRKGYHSMNAMFICDHKLQIRAVNARHGGSCHDSMVWNLSAERAYLNANFVNDKTSWLLGDSGYPLEPWILTPYRAACEDSPESRYNTHLSKTRNTIERCIGLLKGRFRCLLAARELHYSPEKVCLIVNVCSMLHNICIYFNINCDEPLEYDGAEDNIETMVENINMDANVNEASRTRNRIRDIF